MVKPKLIGASGETAVIEQISAISAIPVSITNGLNTSSGVDAA
jgi:hypothetical protein